MVQRKTGRVVKDWDNSDLDLIKQMDWICDRSRLVKLMRMNTRGIVFYCGVASNIDDIRGLFDKVIMLRCSPGVLRKRLSTRTSNDFARNLLVQRWLLHSKTVWENELSQGGTIVINADQSLAKTTDDVLAEAQ
jgi:hypothetical protein